ncbi:MFS general substrate transporter [Aureobasidium pullulans]|uniref:MFS general substrate transporter n=1 Tax=Aureobasidium pullulans TaxID=5580 RepID=A0A4S9LY38_AURPU|nr:MFS general substrate transporter [Aureobasidium pullulans]
MTSRQSSTSSIKSEVKSEFDSSQLSSDQEQYQTGSSPENGILDHKVKPRLKGFVLENSPASTIPNGGFTAWLQVLSGFMCFMSAWGFVNAFGVFQDFYSSVLIPDVSNSDLSWIGSIQAFLLCSATVFAGPVYNYGHPRFLIIFGTILVVFGMMMTSLCSEYWQLMLAQGICVGFGAGCLFLPSIAIVPSYFTTKKAFAMGIAASGSSLGGVIYPIVFHRLEPQIGFEWATRVLGFIAFGTLLVPCFCIKARIFPKTRRKLLDFAAFKEPAYALFNLASFSGLDETLSFYLLPIMSAGSIAGRIVPGLVADRVGALNVLGFCTLCASTLGFCWIAIHHAASGLIIWALLYGALSGAFVSLQPTTVASITKDLSTVGGRMGMNTFCASFGILIGTPIAGLLVESGNWVGMQVFAGATLLGGALLVMATRITVTGLSVSVKA